MSDWPKNKDIPAIRFADRVNRIAPSPTVAISSLALDLRAGGRDVGEGLDVREQPRALGRHRLRRREPLAQRRERRLLSARPLERARRCRADAAAARGVAAARLVARCRRCMEREAPAADTRMLAAPDWDSFTYASEDGLFEPAVDLGAEVVAGQLAGFIHSPETPWRAPVELQFAADGLVVCKRIPGRTERGDCLFHLGADYAG